MRKVPPPINNTCEDSSNIFPTCGSLLKAACNNPPGPRDGTTTHKMRKGSTPRTITTAKSIPHNKNHRRAFAPIPESTSAFIIALSMLLIISNKLSPTTVSTIPRIFILLLYLKLPFRTNHFLLVSYYLHVVLSIRQSKGCHEQRKQSLKDYLLYLLRVRTPASSFFSNLFYLSSLCFNCERRYGMLLER